MVRIKQLDKTSTILYLYFIKRINTNLKHTIMKAKKKIWKINSEGSLVEFNDRLNRFELISRAWSWGDITPGYVRESKRNYKLNN